ncbi:hypothetical protein BD779DRAFT_1676482 [Infundibulicybe gibba]|nr:hypothetical protein BD779DRAFT_1676482 [Infundibulicybe gibba]
MRPEAEAESRMLIGKAAADHLTAEFRRICPKARIVESVEASLQPPPPDEEDLNSNSNKILGFPPKEPRDCYGPIVFAFPFQRDQLIKYIRRFMGAVDTSSVQGEEGFATSRMKVGEIAAAHLTTECRRIWPKARITTSKGGYGMSLLRTHEVNDSLIPPDETVAELEQLMTREGFDGKFCWLYEP